MILCDTGIIVALSNPADHHHQKITQIMANVRGRVATTWACVTESMHLVYLLQNQKTVAELIVSGFLELVELDLDDFRRVSTLMWKYADAPMDIADATLVVAAEKLSVNQILTLDRHFYAYLISDKTRFEVLP